eukprot:109289-Amphidinium_carterae.1
MNASDSEQACLALQALGACQVPKATVLRTVLHKYRILHTMHSSGNSWLGLEGNPTHPPNLLELLELWPQLSSH